MCAHCNEFDVVIDIHGPLQLRRLMKKVRHAVNADQLRCIGLRPGALIDLPSFIDLDLDGPPLPDVIEYQFICRQCDKLFELTVETYHGRGGTWSGK